MIPIGDSPNPRGIAWVTYALIAVNVLVFVLYLPATGQAADPSDPRYREYVETLAGESGVAPEEFQRRGVRLTEYDLVVFEHGSRPAAPSLLDMLTSMFLHGGFMHLLGNMLFLWIYGNNAEFRLGRITYLVAYLATGYVAAFGDVLLRPDSNVPAVGASGAISGVLGMYFLWFPHNKVRLLVFFPPFVQVFDLGARWVLGFYLVVQNLLPVLLGGEGGVAHGAHIGGFVGGVLLALGDNLRLQMGWGKPQPTEDAADPREEIATARAADGGTLAAFRRALTSRDLALASNLLFGATRELSRAGLRPEEAVDVADALHRAGHAQAAAAAYEIALHHRAKGETAAAAHLGLARVLLDDLHQPTAAYQHVYDAVAAGGTPGQEAEARSLLDRLRGQVRSLPGEAIRW